jgi:hypothetical protein
MTIKKIRPDIKFIISGDYNQLLPVNDRISIYTDYSNSPCLFELADYNKKQGHRFETRAIDKKPEPSIRNQGHP